MTKTSLLITESFEHLEIQEIHLWLHAGGLHSQGAVLHRMRLSLLFSPYPSLTVFTHSCVTVVLSYQVSVIPIITWPCLSTRISSSSCLFC